MSDAFPETPARTTVLYGVGRRGDVFTHYVPRGPRWAEVAALCGTNPEGSTLGASHEPWNGRTGRGRVCNTCRALACAVKPIAEIQNPDPNWMWGRR